MITYKSLKLHNYVLFNDAELDLDYAGLTVINGINYNALKDGSKSNGSGKSLLSSAIPNLWFGASPTIMAAKTRTTKDAFYRKDASLELGFGINESTYLVRKYIKGKSFRFDVNEDGNDKSFGTATAAKDWLEAVVPFSEDQFYATQYLDMRRPNLSLVGSGTNRFDFFSSLFDLSAYDSLKDHFVEMRDSLNRERSKLETMQVQLEDVTREIETEETILGNATAKDLDRIQKEIDKARRLSFKVTHAINKIKAAGDNTETYDKEVHQSAVDEIATLTSKLEAHDAHIEWETKSATYSKEYDLLSDALGEAQATLVKKFGKKMLKALPENVAKAKNTIYKLEKADDEYHEVATALNDCGYDASLAEVDRDKVKALQDEFNQLTYSLKAIKKELVRFEDLDSATCPTCGADIDADHVKQETSALKKALALKDQRYAALLRIVPQAEKTLAINEEYARLTKKLAKMKRPDTSKIESFKAFVKAAQAVMKAQSALNDLDVLPKPKSAKRMTDKEADLATRRVAKLKGVVAHQKKLKAMGNLQADLEELGFTDKEAVYAAKDKLEKADIGKANTKMIRKRSALERLEVLRPKLDDLTQQIASVEKNLRNIKVLDALVDAYSKSGLKRFACADLAKMVEGNINDMAGTIYPEKFRFHLDVTRTDFNITYEDRRGTFDIRVMSGAESRMFTVLSMLGILPLMPQRLRSNLIVLDEMDANLDRVSRDMFVNNLVPALNEVIPHVMIVTPSEDVYPGARVVKAVKKGKTSKLIMEG